MTPRRVRVVVALAAGLITLAYLLPFRDYGLNLDDEGLVLSSIQRVVEGQVPYVDFVTGYTPGYFYLSAGLWRLAGDLPTLRASLAVVHAAAIAGVALLAVRVASPALAVVVALLCVGFIPVLPGEFCAFNIPYPAWFATLAWVATVQALVAFVTARRRAALVVAGLAAAAAFATKPNAGVFALAAAVATVLMVEAPIAAARRGPSWLWYLFWAGILAGPWIVFGWPGLRDALAYLVPLSAALLTLPTRARTHRAGLGGDLACLLASFGIPTVPWMAFFWARLGTEAFLRDVLLLGSGAAQLYYVPYPAFEPWALLATVAAAGFAIAGYALRARWMRPWHVALGGAIGLAVSVTAIARLGVMPERTVWSLIWQLESAGFPLTLVTHVAGVVWLWRHRATPGCELPAALLLCALFMHLQVYPRADFTHLVAAVPLTAVFAAYLLEHVLAWWREGLPGGLGRAVAPLAVATLAAVLVLRVSPSLAARLADPGPRLPFAIAPIGVERAHGAGLADLGAAAERLAALVPAGGASITFPAVDIALFLSGARNPTPHHYFFPGRPDHREEAEIVDALTSAPPKAMVTSNAGFTFFDAAPPYYFLLRRFARARYALRERDGRYDVLALAGGTPVPVRHGTHVPEVGRVLDALADRSLAEAAPVFLAHATADDPVLRRAALGALADRLAAEPVDGLEVHVARTGLDRRRQVLLLRTIRDTREARAASYLFASAASPDPRIANEALGAMYVTRAELIARRNLWAGSEEPAVWPGRDALVAAVRNVLADRNGAPRATAFAAQLAGALGNRALVPLLRPWLQSDAATTASAADALARLDPTGLACDLMPLLGRTDLDLMAGVPTTVLALAATPGSVGTEARGCLLRAIGASGPGRETAIWLGAALGDAGFAPAFREALAAETPAVRRAAVWALGEAPSDAATGAVLARARDADSDAAVRRFAAYAIAKQEGRAPRAALATPPQDGSAG